jgi:hypothetical protein
MGRFQKIVPASPPWVRAALLGMLCIALSAGLEPWTDAISGAFVAADIAQDAAAAQLFSDRVNPYGPAIRRPNADLTGLPLSATFPHFPHPPFSLIISFPLAFASWRVAAALWFGFTIALLVLLAVLLDEATSSPAGIGSIGWRRLFVLLLAWPPVLYNLEKGQWSVLLAVLLALAWRGLKRGDLRAGAGWAAAAAAVKVFPVVMGAYFLLRSTRAAAWFAGTGIVLTAVPLLWIGFDAFPAFVRESRLNMPYWESFPLVMFSIHGAIARVFVGGRWAEPLVHAPAIAWLIEGAVVTVLLGLAGWLTIRARRGEVEHSLAFSAWVVLLPLLNPQSLGHNGLLLALPILLLGRTLIDAGREWHRWAWAVSVVLVSIPKQTVWRFAFPPVTPLEGLAVAALPTWGTLLLFMLTVLVASNAAMRSSGRRRVQAAVW